jgi:hypothetical protein
MAFMGWDSWDHAILVGLMLWVGIVSQSHSADGFIIEYFFGLCLQKMKKGSAFRDPGTDAIHIAMLPAYSCAQDYTTPTIDTGCNFFDLR